MTLTYLRIPIVVLKLPDLNLREKLLLGLIISFNSEGLKMSNETLGEILNIWPSRVSGLFKDMEVKNYIQVDNQQSRYRTIYLSKSAKVDELLLTTKRNSKNILLTTKVEATCYQSRNITERTKSLSQKRERGRTHFKKPSPAEVTEYAKTIGYALDGEYFCDTYEARGWTVGLGRSLMQDWRAVVRNWKRREGSQNENRNSKIGTDSAKPNPVARPGEFVR